MITTWIRARNFIFILWTNLVLSCSFFDFSQVRLVSVTPEPDQVFASTNSLSELRVIFSAPMRCLATENAVQLKKINLKHFDESTVAGSYRWESGNADQCILYFIPSDMLGFGKYRLDIGGNCEDRNGNNLEHATNIYFQIGQDDSPPVLLEFLPGEYATNVQRDQNLIFTFSEPIDTDDLLSLFSLDPAANYYIHILSNQTRFELVLLDFMQNGLHSVTLEGIADVYGNAWEDARNFYFTVGNDVSAPWLVGLYTNTMAAALNTNTLHHWGKGQSLDFVFSEPVDIDLDNVPVSFRPALQGRWTLASHILSFEPTGWWELGRPYTIIVPSGIEDFAGNPSRDEVCYNSLICSPDSTFLMLDQARIFTNNLQNDRLNTVIVTNGGGLTNALNLDIHLIFSAPLHPSSSLENISISYVSGSGSLVSPYISQFTFSNAVSPNDSVILKIRDLSYFNLYRLCLQGGRSGLLDTSQNWLQQEINLFMRPEP